MGEARSRPSGLETSDGSAYRRLWERAAALKGPGFWPAQPGKPPLSAMEKAALIRLVDAIPGACGEAAMAAVMQAMRHAPAGDVVEIGSASGRAAALLVWLARRHGVGSMLCVDTWAAGAGDPDEALRIFEINLLPLADGRLNYLRGSAAEAARLYGPDLTVDTEVFGRTAYAGDSALLHFARLAAEAEDAVALADLWTPHVRPGGWIVFGDGAWAEGARRAADAFEARQDSHIAARFEAGGSRFAARLSR